MLPDEAISALNDTDLPIDRLLDIFNSFADNSEIISLLAFHINKRTSAHRNRSETDHALIPLLQGLSSVDNMSCRWIVAKNPYTPAEILEKLSGDPVNLVRALVATNPNTPIDLLHKLFFDEKIVKDGLSGNPSTPTVLLELMSADKDKMVRMRVAENPSTTESILRKMAKDSDINVAKVSQSKLEGRASI